MGFDPIKITEETTWKPEEKQNVYALTKHAAEMEVWRGIQEGVSSVIVNPGVVLGPGFFSSGSGLLFKIIYKGQVELAPRAVAVACERALALVVLVQQVRDDDQRVFLARLRHSLARSTHILGLFWIVPMASLYLTPRRHEVLGLSIALTLFWKVSILEISEPSGGEMCKYSRLYIRKNSPSERTRV